MKKVLISMALLASLATSAQKGNHHRDTMRDMTPEQVATLQTKKMTLAFDLTEAQQEQMMQINLENAQFRKEKMAERRALKEKGELKKPTTEERFAMQNTLLDRKLAQQEKVKQILNEEQYMQWKRFNHRKHIYGKKKMQRSDDRG